MNVPSKLDFAQEVRAERLSLLWKVTLVGSVFVVWAALVLTSLSVISPLDFLLPVLVIVVGCGLCRWMLAARRYEAAVWVYIAGLLLGLVRPASWPRIELDLRSGHALPMAVDHPPRNGVLAPH